MALLEPGDKVMGMRLDQGGHLTHGSPVNFSGRMYDFVAYGVDDDTEMLDYDVIRDLAVRERPRMIIAGATAYPRDHRLRGVPRDRRRGRRAAPRRRRAHRRSRSPAARTRRRFRYADVVTFTTHKTLRGPARRRDPLPAASTRPAIDKAVFPGLQGGPLMHVIAAKAVAFREASQPSFRQYAADVVTNAQALAAGARRRRLPHRVGRYRQPPDARRPAARSA